MQKRRIGSTTIAVSVVGLGTVKFGRNQGVKYPSAFALPSDKEMDHLLGVARALEINLLDTAPAYGLSEERLGKMLRGQRQEWIVSTKAGEEFVDGVSRFDFSAAALVASVERSLKRLQTDYLDIVLVHSSGEDVRLIDEERVFETMERLQQMGKLRAFGMSTKTIAGGIKTIDRADLAMVAFNPSYCDEREVIAYAKEKNKGVFVKKALNSGHLSAEEALPFVVNEPGVTSVIIGTLSPLHLEQNVRMLD